MPRCRHCSIPTARSAIRPIRMPAVLSHAALRQTNDRRSIAGTVKRNLAPIRLGEPCHFRACPDRATVGANRASSRPTHRRKICPHAAPRTAHGPQAGPPGRAKLRKSVARGVAVPAARSVDEKSSNRRRQTDILARGLAPVDQPLSSSSAAAVARPAMPAFLTLPRRTAFARRREGDCRRAGSTANRD